MKTLSCENYFVYYHFCQKNFFTHDFYIWIRKSLIYILSRISLGLIIIKGHSPLSSLSRKINEDYESKANFQNKSGNKSQINEVYQW